MGYEAGAAAIGLDLHMVGTGETGNETYAVELARALGRLGGYAYRLYTPDPAALPPDLAALSAATVRPFADVPAPVRIAWRYPRLVRADGLRLLHMQYVAPFPLRCPLVLTVHDVSYRRYPQFFAPRVRFLVSALIGPSLRRAARVITISECSRRDILHFYRLPPQRVVVTPLAAGPAFTPQPPAEIAQVRAAYGLPERYFLAVGNVQPRKNLTRLVEAFGRVAAADPDVQLVCAGPSAWGGSAVAATVARLGLGARVRFTGYVPGADLPALYSGALAFCYPSLYEGFGLPLLEAMACGTATITSTVSSLPEVAGDAALMVDPYAVPEIAAALCRLLGEPATRAVYQARGLARAAQFSWARTAQLTRAVYDGVLGTPRTVA